MIMMAPHNGDGKDLYQPILEFGLADNSVGK